MRHGTGQYVVNARQIALLIVVKQTRRLQRTQLV